MIAPRVEITPVRLARRLAGVFVGLAVLACAITLVFLSLDAALTETYGCAREAGGHCEVALFIPVSIFLGLGGLGAYVVANRLPAGPRIAGLAWPALFLAVGGAFLDAAVAGQGWGWGILGAFVVVMGLTPVALWRREAWRRMLWGPAPERAAGPRSGYRGERWISPIRLPGAGVGGPEAVPLEHNLVGELERLSALHSAGHLDDEEFAAAKARLLNGAH